MQEVDYGDKLSVFIPKALKGKIVLPFIVCLGIGDGTFSKSKLFQNINFDDFKNIINISDSVSESDLILVPHDFSYLKNNFHYLDEIIMLGKEHCKKIVLFYYSDSSCDINLDNVIVIRSSRYASDLRDNEIIMPAYVEALHERYGLAYREKSTKPSVGFVGQASFRGIKHRILYIIKNYFLLSGSRREGVFFRRKLIREFNKNKSIISRFKLRKFYSGNIKSIEGDMESIRNEYINNVLDSDFTLSPKGDGNYSLRFYETLALGRIPILLNTDMKLPLDGIINYNEFIIQLSLDDINKSSDIVYRFWQNLSNDEFIIMQKKSHNIFANYLYMPRFLSIIFTKSFMRKYLN